MKLFIGTNWPQCEALKKRIDLYQVPNLKVHIIPDSGVLASLKPRSRSWSTATQTPSRAGSVVSAPLTTSRRRPCCGD